MEIEGLTGEIRFNDDGRRHNYTLHVVEMTVNSAMVKVNIFFSFLFRSISHSPFPSLSLHQFPKCPINHISRSRENRDIAIRLLSFLPSFLSFSRSFHEFARQYWPSIITNTRAYTLIATCISSNYQLFTIYLSRWLNGRTRLDSRQSRQSTFDFDRTRKSRRIKPTLSQPSW